MSCGRISTIYIARNASCRLDPNLQTQINETFVNPSISDLHAIIFQFVGLDDCGFSFENKQDKRLVIFRLCFMILKSILMPCLNTSFSRIRREQPHFFHQNRILPKYELSPFCRIDFYSQVTETIKWNLGRKSNKFGHVSRFLSFSPSLSEPRNNAAISLILRARLFHKIKANYSHSHSFRSIFQGPNRERMRCKVFEKQSKEVAGRS